jgi:predicted lipoprotein with Yx(FWY)xxD motif
MRRTATCLLPAVAASLALGACGGSSYSAGSSSSSNAAATSSSSSGGVVKTAANSTLGTTVLTDAGGRTLYRLSGEQAGRFICTSGCLQIWHPLAASSGNTPSASVASLGTVKRPDGGEQVTYKGMPLYTFASDQQPGDAKGQGLKDVGTWNAVTVAAATTPTATTESPPATSGGSYRY